MPRAIPQLRRKAKALFRACLIEGKLDDHRARTVVSHIVDSKKRGYIALLAEFTRLLGLERSRHTATVQTAVALRPDLQRRVVGELVAAYGQALKTQFMQSADLIGGMRIQVGSDVFDGSVKARLDVLAVRFGLVK